MFWYRDDEITVVKKSCGTVLDSTLIDESVVSFIFILNKTPSVI